MTRQLIVSADDLGLHEAINRGVLEGYEEGIVTAASIVACGSAFEDAARLVSRRRKLDIGIHLTLVEEEPVLRSGRLGTLAPNGRFPKTYRELFFALIKGKIRLREVELELDAQIQRVLDAGLTVSHLDSHQHTHFFPQIRPIVMSLAEKHGIRGVRAGAKVVPGRTRFSLFLGPLAKRAHREARSYGFVTPDALWLPSPSGRMSGLQLVKGIPRLPQGVTELVVHPGADQRALDRVYPHWQFKWRQELAAVQASDVRDALDRNKVTLTRYSELE